LPPIQYSIRRGLLLDDEQVQALLASKDEQQQVEPYREADLVQEGLTALLDAMQLYRQEQKQKDKQNDKTGNDSTVLSSTTVSKAVTTRTRKTRSTSDFETYATKHQTYSSTIATGNSQR